MSASLVGSEMCIRDSNGAGRTPPELQGPHSSSFERLKPFRTFKDWRAPVSYTHLTLPTICSV
eukprot:1646831-Alexandrium_andersonii.AAC.1